VADRVIFDGEPGTRYTNDTGKIQYQFIAALINTCGVCLQYHMKVSRAWPIPIHRNCRCIQRQIKPGGQAPRDFVDYRKLLDEMEPDQQAAAVGASSYRLLKAGVITWEDVVTPSRVRTLEEIVAKKRLTVDQMVKAGVKPFWANKAYNAVHTEEHERVRAHRAGLIKNLEKAGLSQEQLVKELGGRLAGRLVIGPGPEGPYTKGPAWPGGPVPGTGGSSAAELAGLIAAWKPAKQKAAMPKKPESKPEAPKPERQQQTPAVPPTPKPPEPESEPEWMKRLDLEKLLAKEAAHVPLPEHDQQWHRNIRDFIRYGKQQGYEITPLRGKDLDRYLKTKKERRNAPIFYNAPERRIYINADSVFWPEMHQITEAQAKRGWWVSDRPFSTVDHEIAHAKHHDSVKSLTKSAMSVTWDKATKELAKSQVSGYAASSPLEFVAEVYSGIKHGKTFGPRIMALYKRIGGPPVDG
jgi:hypothetical protein